MISIAYWKFHVDVYLLPSSDNFILLIEVGVLEGEFEVSLINKDVPCRCYSTMAFAVMTQKDFENEVCIGIQLCWVKLFVLIEKCCPHPTEMNEEVFRRGDGKMKVWIFLLFFSDICCIDGVQHPNGTGIALFNCNLANRNII